MATPVQAASSSSASAATLSATLPSAPTTGNVITVFASVGTVAGTTNTATVKDGAGTTLSPAGTEAVNGSTYSVTGVCCRYVVPATPQATFTATFTPGSSNGIGILVIEWPAAAMSTTVDGTFGTNAVGSGSTSGSATYSSSATGEVMLIMASDPGIATTFTLPTGYNPPLSGGSTGTNVNINGSSNANLCVGYKTSTGGSEANTWSWTDSGDEVVMLAGAFTVGGPASASVTGQANVIGGDFPSGADASIGSGPFLYIKAYNLG